MRRNASEQDDIFMMISLALGQILGMIFANGFQVASRSRGVVCWRVGGLFLFSRFFLIL